MSSSSTKDEAKGQGAAGAEGPKLPQRIEDYRATAEPVTYNDDKPHAKPMQCADCKGWLKAQRFTMGRWVEEIAPKPKPNPKPNPAGVPRMGEPVGKGEGEGEGRSDWASRRS